MKVECLSKTMKIQLAMHEEIAIRYNSPVSYKFTFRIIYNQPRNIKASENKFRVLYTVIQILYSDISDPVPPFVLFLETRVTNSSKMWHSYSFISYAFFRQFIEFDRRCPALY